MTSWFESIYGQGKFAMVQCTQTLVRLFRPNEIKNHPSKKDNAGNPLQYLDTSSCIDRLNEAFTPLGWSFTVSSPIYPPMPGDRPHLIPHNLAVIGTLTIHTPWGDISKQQYGSSIIKSLWEGKDFTTKPPTEVNRFGTDNSYNQQKAEFGDDLKGAASDALKKCATLVGVGNYISRKGKASVSTEAVSALNELKAISERRGLTRDQMLEYCGGVTRKTVYGAEDLSLTQAQACVALLSAENSPIQ